ncbi:MAG TPA: tryptophan 7-halogenase [Chthoniobacterales bacterium]|nr:tryptophan 7-halogenase [Chthoniobacterales bacterium]
MKKREVIIIGGGPGGAATALYLIQAGIKPLIVERQSFPRFHIGESLSGECGNAIRKLDLEEQLLAQNYPVKYGVNVYNPQGVPFWVEVKKRCPDTNAMIPNSTWSVTRSSFDKILLDAALARGAEYMPCDAVAPLQEESGRIIGLQIRTPGGALEDLHSDVLVDCSGQATFLANRGVTGPKVKGSYANQVGIYSQIEGMTLDSGTEPSKALGNTLIFYKDRDHWAWTIPLRPDLVSVGVVAPAAHFKEQGLEKTEYLRREIESLNPELSRRVSSTSFVEEVRSVTSYCYAATNYAGPGYICVGDSHQFTDPIFSFGVFLAMKEAEFAAEAIKKHLGQNGQRESDPFEEYQVATTEGQDAIRDVIDTFWEYPLVFTRMASGTAQDDITDLFAGRVYGDIVRNNPSRAAMRRLLAKRRGQPVPAAPSLS